jgi:hypothetical protein
VSDHRHYADEIHGAAEQHHRHHDLESLIDGLREDLNRALERIRELEQDTPQARQLEHEADAAMADAREFDYHGPDCQCSYCPGWARPVTP